MRAARCSRVHRLDVVRTINHPSVTKRKKVRPNQEQPRVPVPQGEASSGAEDLSAQADAMHDELLEQICTTIDRMHAEMRLLVAQYEQADLVNAGLMKLILVQEFRDQQRIGQCYQRQQLELHDAGQPAKLLTDEQRDNTAARAAFDRLIEVMPPETQGPLEKNRAAMLEMLMHHAGYKPGN